MSAQYKWYGSWIWNRKNPQPNSWAYFRREITLDQLANKSHIHITADSTYELFINGERIGRGPARGYPFRYFYDTYDITSYIQQDIPVVIGVIASYMGDHSMCYVAGDAGLLCDIIIENQDGARQVIGTDSQWITAPFTPMSQHAPRISKQLEFEEHYDANEELLGWHHDNFDTTAWQPAQVLRKPDTSLVARDIPFLTEDAVAPQQILLTEIAQRKDGLAWTFDLRELANTDLKGLESSGPGQRGWLLFSEVWVDETCEAHFITYPDYEIVELRVNDQTFRPFDKFHPKRWTVTLQKGANLVMLRNARWPALFIECEQPFRLSAERYMDDATWVFAGPFDERDSDTYWTGEQPITIPQSIPCVALTDEDNKLDVFVETTSQTYFAVDGGFCDVSINEPQPRKKLIGSEPIHIENLSALLHDNADWTTIAPHPDGAIHFVIDFGHEVVGYLEFDIDAEAGTILDANCFEAIDESGIYWMGSMRNTFRYICREGRQVWQSHRRRGFRYMSLTIRNFSRPLTIRHLNLYQSVYPVHSVGDFYSSDASLNAIWDVAAYTVQLCMLDTYVDCPGFEQVFWVGDARNSALVNAVAFGAYDLTARCNHLVADSLSPKMAPIIPDFYTNREHLTASHAVSGWFDEIPMWTFLWIWTVWEHYLYTGDLEQLRDLYPAVQDCLQRAETMLSSRDLFAIENCWNMMDHAANDNERYGEIIGNSVLFVRSLETAASMAQIFNDEHKADHYLDLANHVRDAVNTYGWSDHYQAYVDTVRDQSAYDDYLARCHVQNEMPISFDAYQQKQRISEQTNTLALLCNCVPLERRTKVIPYATAATAGKFVASRTEYAFLGSPDDVVAVGSPYFLFFTLETLFQEGFAHEALTIIREQWQKMLDKGATTFWETFPGDVSKGHWSRSMCHGWSSAPAYFLSTQILGITPLEPGFKRVRIAPQVFDLQWARGTVPTPVGAISVHWRIDADGAFQLDYTVPDGCDVEIDYPKPLRSLL